MPTTIDNETELSAVNSILGSIGQSPVTTLGETGDGNITYENPEIAFIYNLLRDSNIDVQNEGWHFNTEHHVEFNVDTSNSNRIYIGNNILRADVTDGWVDREYDVVVRNNYLYDKFDHTDDWSELSDNKIELDVVYLFEFEKLPSVFKRYITYRASRMAATQLVANPQLVQLLTQQESLARAACMEYECNQGNHSMFGFPDDSHVTTYQPFRSLRRR